MYVFLNPRAVVLHLQVVQTAIDYRFEGVGLVVFRFQVATFFLHPDKTFVHYVLGCAVVVDVGICYFYKHHPATGEYSSEFFFSQFS